MHQSLIVHLHQNESLFFNFLKNSKSAPRSRARDLLGAWDPAGDRPRIDATPPRPRQSAPLPANHRAALVIIARNVSQRWAEFTALQSVIRHVGRWCNYYSKQHWSSNVALDLVQLAFTALGCVKQMLT